MERRTGPAGRSSDDNDASQPNTPNGTDATHLMKTKTAATHPQDGSHGTPNPEVPTRAWIAPNMRDGVELENMSPASMTSSPGSISSGSLRMVTQQETRVSMRSTASREPTGTFAPVVKFWRRHVVLSVAQKQCRDHFGKDVYVIVVLVCLYSLRGVNDTSPIDEEKSLDGFTPIYTELQNLKYAVFSMAGISWLSAVRPCCCALPLKHTETVLERFQIHTDSPSIQL